jgi:alkylated DNA repair protein (DNA oxidative demethylase)
MSDQLSLDLAEGATGELHPLAEGAALLRGFALAGAARLHRDVEAVAAAAPFRNMQTPGGFTMSVAMTNCGALGWVSDMRGYRYTPVDPETGQAWPWMPASFRELARDAAERVGFAEFEPDACLVNRYGPGARLTLHQDKNERDFAAPIVSVSLGVPAVFLFGASTRKQKPLRVPLRHGDVVVWGGPARLHYHGVLPLKEAQHPMFGAHRVNLTLRKAG